MTHPTPGQDAHLSAGSYKLWATLLLALGLYGAYIALQFLNASLGKTETDQDMKNLLLAAGALFVAAQALCFGLAALLPKQKLKGVRLRLMVFAAAVMLFEMVTIFVSQVMVIKSGDAGAVANNTRAEILQRNLQTRLDAQEKLAERGRTKGLLKATHETEQLSQTLAQVQQAQRPTITEVLTDIGGDKSVIGYAFARALLIALLPHILLGAAGALYRIARDLESGKPEELNPAQPAGGLPRVPGRRGVAAALLAVLLGARGVPAQAKAPTTEPDQVQTTRPASQPPRPQHPKERKDSGIIQPGATNRYNQVKQKIIGGKLKPSVRFVAAEFGCGKDVARKYLNAMVYDGCLRKDRRGFSLIK